MDKKNQTLKALSKAVEIAGGQMALARLITSAELPVSQSHVSMWLNRMSVPAEYCPAIERETGVKCELLNAKADWSYLRECACKE